ncbi:MAG: ATP-dependent helicase/nuclease subunit A, partial [Natronomonas sp.]
MRGDVFENGEEGMGTEFGTTVHDFAEAYALGEAVTPEDDDERHATRCLDDLDGHLLHQPGDVSGSGSTM